MNRYASRVPSTSKSSIPVFKYGGSYAAERKLSIKLTKKYGSRVKLLLAEGREKQKEGSTVHRFDESWFEAPQQKDLSSEAVLDFCSAKFDPLALLYASDAKVNEWNSCYAPSAQCLDNTHQFAQFLPIEDPLHSPAFRTAKEPTLQKYVLPRHIKSWHPFVQIADSLQSGPISMLRTLRQQRVCVTTRYVNAIRGSLTGTLIAFDKHLNLLLVDVEETYTARPSARGTATNNHVEVERQWIVKEPESPRIPTAVKRRRMKQIMLRGDSVVSIYKQGTK